MKAGTIQAVFEYRFRGLLDEFHARKPHPQLRHLGVVDPQLGHSGVDKFVHTMEDWLMNHWGRLEQSTPIADKRRSNDENFWMNIGSSVLHYLSRDDHTDHASQNRMDIALLLAKKRVDYGDKNIVAFGQKGIIVRCMDKIHRLHNLLKRDGESAVGESIEDAFTDIIGYCAVSILYLRKEWMDDTIPKVKSTITHWVPVGSYLRPDENVLLSTGAGDIFIGRWHDGLRVWVSSTGDVLLSSEDVLYWAPLPTAPHLSEGHPVFDGKKWEKHLADRPLSHPTDRTYGWEPWE